MLNSSQEPHRETQAGNAVARTTLDTLTPDRFYRDFRARSRPVVITGALAGAPDWNLDYLCARLGEAPYQARHYGRDHFKQAKRQWRAYSQGMAITAAAYGELLRDRRAHTENIYLAQVDIGGTPAAASIRPLVDELASRCGMERYPPSDLNIWLGPAGHTEPLHFDGGDGTLMQLHGAKKVVLFPPAQTENLYPFPFGKGTIPPWFSQVDTDRPDFDAFPNYRTALTERRAVILEQGEILYIPASWWHEVTALGDDYVCSVNRFWKVKPVTRNFCTRRSGILYLVNRLPWPLILRLDRWIRAFSRRGRSA